MEKGKKKKILQNRDHLNEHPSNLRSHLSPLRILSVKITSLFLPGVVAHPGTWEAESGGLPEASRS